MPERKYTAASGYRYGFNGKENDNEPKGEGNSLDYGARIYDPRVGRWLSVDPLVHKYAQYSPYIGFADNPVIYKDPDGRDIVYFNNKGHEIFRIPSNTRFETYVQSDMRAKAINGFPSVKEFRDKPLESLKTSLNFLIFEPFESVAMPKIIQNHQAGEATTDPKFQKYDYQIAASAYLFNKKKSDIQFYTDGGNPIPKENNAQIADMDPTLLKAVAIHETVAGTNSGNHGDVDVMQVNNTVSNNADWADYKSNYGLKKGVLPSPEQSINFAPINWAIKGFKNGIPGDGTYNWQGVNSATKNYNGGGDPGYLPDIQKMLQEAVDPKPENYVKPIK